ncbi:hypothetical protein TELCIR_09635 [Teladorsagia circumcincta]|uniref:Peptidase A2 domain-containing protein n=1 Tax=Teladorsagia circumcincta TaxID=45464 RepID=A0A2G9UED0_TELCI|nr:hypothetical protein TELCIR_09635 [Teladorsagia circumcincta]
MDSDTLRAILEAQATAQQKTLGTLMEKMEKMFNDDQLQRELVLDNGICNKSLSARLPDFTFDPENGCTFDVWYNGYEDVITQYGATLDDAANSRPIVSKLDAAAFARFTYHISPKKPAEVSVQDIVKTLQELFGRNTSVFARRYTYLQKQCSAEQMKCLVWICGLSVSDYADIRAHALRKVGENPHLALKELSTTDKRTVTIDGTPTRTRLDTGADVTLLSLKDWITFGRPKLLPPLFALRSADNKEIKVRGHFQCNFSIEGNEGRDTCHVTDTTSLLDWMTQFEPLFHHLTGNTTCNAESATTLAKLRSSLTAQLQKQFAVVFAPGLGRCTKSKASLKLKPDATPVFWKARPAPYAVLPRISQEIDRIIAANVLSPVDHCDWAAPIVVVQKNGSTRLCADFSTGLNEVLNQHQHPLPKPDDIFTKLNGGQYFSQLDLAEAYLQLEMDEEFRPLLKINTLQGLYRLNRLLFRMKSAPAIFQQQMDTMTAGLDVSQLILSTNRYWQDHK